MAAVSLHFPPSALLSNFYRSGLFAVTVFFQVSAKKPPVQLPLIECTRCFHCGQAFNTIERYKKHIEECPPLTFPDLRNEKHDSDFDQ